MRTTREEMDKIVNDHFTGEAADDLDDAGSPLALERLDLDALLREIERYLAAVELFRAERGELCWRV